MSSINDEKDPLLDELEERIAEGPVMFTPDEEFLERVAKKRKEINEKGEKTGEKPETMTQKDAMMFPIIASCALGGLYLFFKIFWF